MTFNTIMTLLVIIFFVIVLGAGIYFYFRDKQV